MKCPDGHGDMTLEEAIKPRAAQEHWRCSVCGWGVVITYARLAPVELQELINLLPDEDDNATSFLHDKH